MLCRGHGERGCGIQERTSQRMSTEVISRVSYKPLADGAGSVGIDKQLEWYRLIHLGRLLDDKARNYLRQAKGWSYHASHAGHDGIQIARAWHSGQTRTSCSRTIATCLPRLQRGSLRS